MRTTIGVSVLKYIDNSVEGEGGSLEAIEMSIIEKEEEATKIASIDYDSQYQRNQVTVSVTTTSNNYGLITINAQKSRQVYKNGNYMVVIVNDGEITDQREIQITNIDKKPIEYTYTEEDNTYIISVNDDLSGVNYDSLIMH